MLVDNRGQIHTAHIDEHEEQHMFVCKYMSSDVSTVMREHSIFKWGLQVEQLALEALVNNKDCLEWTDMHLSAADMQAT